MQDDANNKNLDDERIFHLEPIPGEKVIQNTGLVDNRLFTGEANLHAVRDPTYPHLWLFKYKHGTLPTPLKQHFTSFAKLKKFAEEYFGRRGLRISQIDA